MNVCAQSYRAGPTLARRPAVLVAGLGIVLALAVLTGTHAVVRHGDEAEAVRSCVKDSGRVLIYKARSEPNKFFILCQLPGDGRWGMQIVVRLKQVLQEVTSYVPKDGSWQEVSSYVLRQATRWQGPLP